MYNSGVTWLVIVVTVSTEMAIIAIGIAIGHDYEWTCRHGPCHGHGHTLLAIATIFF